MVIKLGRYSYFIISLLVLGAAALFLVWFYNDMLYLFSGGVYDYTIARFGAFLSTLILGIFYLSLGICPKRINKWSNLSIVGLLGFLIISLITFMISSLGMTTGSKTPVFLIIARQIMIITVVLALVWAIILGLISIFYKEKKSHKKAKNL